MSGHRPFKKLTLKEARRDPRYGESRPRAWTHQADLTEAISKKVAIRLADLAGTFVAGTLVAADQYSVKIRLPEDPQLGTDGQTREPVIFKSAIALFEIDPPIKKTIHGPEIAKAA